MRDEPTISVIIPAYNAERFLVEAVQSVLRQVTAAQEVVIVDDGSTDGSLRLAQSLASPIVRVLSQSNQGAAAARNLGIRSVTGDLLAFLDADDLMSDDRLAVQSEAFRQDQELMILFGQQYMFRDGDDPLAVLRSGSASDSQVSPSINAGGMLCRRRVFDTVGEFEPQMQLGEFISWTARAQDAGFSYRVLPEVVNCRRVHADNTVNRVDKIEFTKMVKAHLDRRRAAGKKS